MTKPLAEVAAKVNLQNQGYDVYFPQLVRKRIFKGKWRNCISALFPRYVFVQLDINRQSLAPIRSTKGVSCVLRFGHDYAVMPEEVIKGILAKADPATGLHHLKSRRNINPGDEVRLVRGMFDGLMGLFERELGEDRVSVLLGILGRQVTLTFPVAEIELP